MQLDRYDTRIVTELQRNGRLSVVELAEIIGLSATPCARRVKALEAAGIIEGYSALIDPAKIGLAILAMVQVKLEHTDESVTRFEEAVSTLDEITSCFALTGAFDFMLQVYARDLESLGAVVLKKLLRIPGVRDVQSSVVLETIKRSPRVPLAHLD